MKIRKKAPKPSARRPPLYFIGYRGTAPAPDELKTWYDLEYGGPLTLRTESAAAEAWHIGHGPWSAHVVIPLPATQATHVMEQLAWEHKVMGAVAPSVATPPNMADTILLAARLARGLTLLTQGTAFDVTSQSYLNPSDWNDRALTVFRVRDHVTVTQAGSDGDTQDWLYTLGLGKFGLDELELLQPRGLPTTEVTDAMMEVADEIIRRGQTPKVGTVIDVPALARTVLVAGHRTASLMGKLVILRRIEL
ncbi:MAG: hypothetical protein ACT4OO_11435 [Nitrospiraceae bacterium]